MPKLFYGILLFFVTTFSFGQVSQDSFSVHGYVEPYYSWSKGKARENIYLFNFRKENEPSINLALISLYFNRSKYTYRLSLQAGDYSVYNYASEPTFFRHIYEASISRSIGQKMELKAGIFPSHMGFESAIGKENLTLTRSIDAEYTPYYVAGLKFGLKASDKVHINILAINGWQRIRDNNSSPAFGSQIVYESKNIHINYSTILGNEQNKGEPSRVRFHNDFFVKLFIRNRLSLIGSFDIGIEGKEAYTYYNPSLLARWKIFSKIFLGGRMEYYKDPKEVIIATPDGQGTELWSFSFNIDYMILHNLLLRIEGRRFYSDKNIYLTKSGFSSDKLVIISSIAYSF